MSEGTTSSTTGGGAGELSSAPPTGVWGSSRRWYFVGGGFALLLIPVFLEAVTGDRPWPIRVLLAIAVLGYASTYLFGQWWVQDRSLPSKLLVVGLALAFLTVIVVVIDPAMSGYASFALVVVAGQFRPSVAALGCLATILGVIGLRALLGSPIEPGEIIVDASIAVAMIFMFKLSRSNRELHVAREEVARLAVEHERARMARDLHDVLGHSLTTITVKAALARRLLEAGDGERAAMEIGDVERLGREALADVRTTVSARRSMSLAGELAGAREALRAAGIEADLPQAVDEVPDAHRQAFAHVLREGVTNVIRHSKAARCTVRLGPGFVEVSDDGVGTATNGTATNGTATNGTATNGAATNGAASNGTATNGAAPIDSAPIGSAPIGNGLRGLDERLAVVGGRLSAGPVDGGGYRLRAECPTTATP